MAEICQECTFWISNFAWFSIHKLITLVSSSFFFLSFIGNLFTMTLFVCVDVSCVIFYIFSSFNGNTTIEMNYYWIWKCANRAKFTCNYKSLCFDLSSKCVCIVMGHYSYRLYTNSFAHTKKEVRFHCLSCGFLLSCFHLFASVISDKQEVTFLCRNTHTRTHAHHLPIVSFSFVLFFALSLSLVSYAMANIRLYLALSHFNFRYLYFDLWNSVPTSKHWKLQPSDFFIFI